MKNYLFSIILSALCFSSLSHAGGEVGNGGNAVVCYKDATQKMVTSTEMFDYWEMSRAFPEYGVVDLGNPSLSIVDKINLFVDRVERFDSALGKRIRNVAISIATNLPAYVIKGSKIPDADDDHPLVLPDVPCYKLSYAIQWRDVQSGSRRFVVSDFIFNHPKTTNDTRAGIILHEAIYRVAIVNGATNSDGTRFFHYVMASKASSKMTGAKFTELIKKTGLPLGNICSVVQTNMGRIYHFKKNLCMPLSFETKTMIFHMEDASFVLSGKIIQQIDVYTGYVALKTNPEKFYQIPSSFQKIIFSLDPEYTPGINGFVPMSMSGGILADEARFEIKIGGTSYPCRFQPLQQYYFDETGSVTGCALEGKPMVKYKKYEFPLEMWQTTNGKGVLLEANISGPHKLLLPGAKKEVLVDGNFKFDAKGDIVSGGFATPYLIKFPDATVKADTFYLNTSGRYVSMVKYNIFQPTVQDKRILVKTREDELAFCTGLGFLNVKVPPSPNIEYRYVTQTQTFFDPKLNRVVPRTDEEVYLLVGSNCLGEFELNF